jgi:transcription antitermination factor NusG
MSVDNHWYVLRSKPHKERALRDYAQRSGHEVFLPSIPVRPVNPRASRVRPYFPGYLFLHASLADDGQSVFRWMPFSQGLVHVGGEPAPVADLVIRALQARLAEIWRAGGLAAPDWVRGERVVIRQGLFEGYQGIFDARLPGRARVRVLLKMLSDRYVPVEVDSALIGKTGP